MSIGVPQKDYLHPLKPLRTGTRDDGPHWQTEALVQPHVCQVIVVCEDKRIVLFRFGPDAGEREGEWWPCSVIGHGTLEQSIASAIRTDLHVSEPPKEIEVFATATLTERVGDVPITKEYWCVANLPISSGELPAFLPSGIATDRRAFSREDLRDLPLSAEVRAACHRIGWIPNQGKIRPSPVMGSEWPDMLRSRFR